MTVFNAAGTPLGASLAEYREYGTLFFFLAMRDIRLRYRQTTLGVLWAIVQPLFPMLIFAAVFSRLLKPGAAGVPYPLFVFSGLAPWTFLAASIQAGSPAFLNNFSLLNKVYFPRAILPAAAVAACALDGLVAAIAVLASCLYYGYYPWAGWLLLPAIACWACLLAAAATLFAACLAVAFRDMKNVIPFAVQIWMYLTPVLYPAELIPAPLRLAAGFNPMAGVVEAFRACLFRTRPDAVVLAQSLFSLVAVLVLAVTVFRHLEADLAERA